MSCTYDTTAAPVVRELTPFAHRRDCIKMAENAQTMTPSSPQAQAANQGSSTAISDEDGGPITTTTQQPPTSMSTGSTVTATEQTALSGIGETGNSETHVAAPTTATATDTAVASILPQAQPQAQPQAPEHNDQPSQLQPLQVETVPSTDSQDGLRKQQQQDDFRDEFEHRNKAQTAQIVHVAMLMLFGLVMLSILLALVAIARYGLVAFVGLGVMVVVVAVVGLTLHGVMNEQDAKLRPIQRQVKHGIAGIQQWVADEVEAFQSEWQEYQLLLTNGEVGVAGDVGGADADDNDVESNGAGYHQMDGDDEGGRTGERSSAVGSSSTQYQQQQGGHKKKKKKKKASYKSLMANMMKETNKDADKEREALRDGLGGGNFSKVAKI
uniref:Uncharacterized protein n=1 Tax=Craspedostauros australis TaxID=1486917 RepID=A0A6T6EE42_9STRA